MNKDVKYDVLREHEGDKFYRERDTRFLKATDAAALVALGVLAEHDPDRFAGTEDDSAQTAIIEAIADIDQGLEDRRIEVTRLINEENERLENVRSNNADAIAALEADLQKVRTSAEQEISEINAGVTKAREEANVEIGKIEDEIAAKKADPALLNKADKTPRNKAE